MASMGSVFNYGQLARSARVSVLVVPRRPLSYTVPRLAEEDNSNHGAKAESAVTNSPLSSIKNFFFGGRKGAAKPTVARRATPAKREGSLSADSIFAEDDTSPKLIPKGRTPARKGAAGEVQPEEEAAEAIRTLEQRDRTNMGSVLDPRPHARVRWEKKMVIREIRRRGRLSKAEQIMRTERESLSKSHWFKTSTKKLGPLARQIAGKNIDDAIVQMRFSKKKAAKDVLEHLKHAKNVATVRAGMGLSSGKTGKPTTITLKSGERKTITDPTSIYIEQAWVNRGPYGADFDHRARGVINMLRPPYTSLSVVLKEEKTRIRECQDRDAKEQRRRRDQLWTALPDRKITGQSQYYSW
ncbi:hypothetical protein ASPZODRAFT_14867 [Penicilliopsis zonata CBS 506.65]|uniref:Ribosomal protein L22 n=1 Tax=Penicilliopsis zonata CBS 506.65 TaxID=1073090 RepID=A0A1L9SNA1_9EURO|nr:hypothetical protein ASPZODRAFT_14867 [Penicilliopsis zonata CBS 506.65]OJJ48742.1 hypothetical protein ASPZODRAFT_14867 [Penicilliopsis zonata CBS 506.65]